MPTDLPTRPAADPGSEPNAAGDAASAKAPPPLQAVFAAVTLAALATLVLMPILGEHSGRQEPFLVAISPPRVEQPTSLSTQHLQTLVTAIQDAAERHLSGREGLLWTRAEAAGDDASAAAAARAVGAEEALVLTVSCDSICRVSARRIRAVDGSTTWQRPSFRLKLEDPLEIERTLGDHLAIAYLKFTRRSGAPRLFASGADYRRYLGLRRQMDTTTAPAALADALADVRQGSPRFFSSYLFEAQLRARAAAEDADSDGYGHGDDGMVVELLLDAHRIAPSDPRPLQEAVPRLVALGRALEAKDLLRELETLYPKHPELGRLRPLTAGETDPAAGRNASTPDDA